MAGRNTNAGLSLGVATVTQESRAEFEALERLPAAARSRLTHATLPIDPVTLLDYYCKCLGAGYSQRAAEGAVIDSIIKTEELYAGLLERERATWEIGKEMAVSFKAWLGRVRSGKAPRSGIAL